jgi:GNAT superfamily N-acetyltransferase
MMSSPPQIQIRTQLAPGDLGYIIYLHGILYPREYGLGGTFEADVAIRFGEFVKTFDPRKDYIAVAEADGRVAGSIIVDSESDEVALIRWFLVHPDMRGRGVGRQLINDALAFSRERGFRKVRLWTMNEFKAAVYLYKEAGFVCTHEAPREIWGAARTEQEYELNL